MSPITSRYTFVILLVLAVEANISISSAHNSLGWSNDKEWTFNVLSSGNKFVQYLKHDWYLGSVLDATHEGTDSTDKSLFQWDIVSLRLSTILIPNMTMTFAHRRSKAGFLENEFSTIKNFFFQNDFLIFPDYRACKVGHKKPTFYLYKWAFERCITILFILKSKTQLNHVYVRKNKDERNETCLLYMPSNLVSRGYSKTSIIGSCNLLLSIDI
jgi:hypothetical protein